MARLGSLPRAGRVATRPGGPPMISVLTEEICRRRVQSFTAEIMGPPDNKPGDDDQEEMIGQSTACR